MKSVIDGMKVGELDMLVQTIMNKMDISSPQEALRRLVSGEWTVERATLPKLSTWLSVAISGRSNAEADRKSLVEAGVEVHRNALALLWASTYDYSCTTEELVLATSKDLGLKGEATTPEICTAAKLRQLVNCPVPVVAQLWLQHPGIVASKECVMLAHTPEDVFYLRHSVDGQRRLDAQIISQDHLWRIENRWVFARQRH